LALWQIDCLNKLPEYWAEVASPLHQLANNMKNSHANGDRYLMGRTVHDLN
jgi:hypothetical protein